MNKDPKKFIHENNNLGPEDEAVISFLLKSEPEIKPSPLFVQNLKEKIATQKIITVRPSPYVFFMEYRYAFSFVVLLLIFSPVAYRLSTRSALEPTTPIQSLEQSTGTTPQTPQMEMVAPAADTTTTPTNFRKTTGDSIENIIFLAIVKKERVKPEDVFIINIEKQTWSDNCLGLPEKREECTKILTSGYHIEVLVNGKEVIYRSDTSGVTIRKEI